MIKFHYQGLVKVISGGQTGADQAGIFTASDFGVATGGMIPKGWRTSDGPAPHLAALGVIEHSSPQYPPRTLCNVQNSSATVRLAADFKTAGEVLTAKYCRIEGKPVFDILLDGKYHEQKAEGLVDFLKQHSVSILNVAGNRETKPAFIFEDARLILQYAFTMMDAENLLIKLQED